MLDSIRKLFAPTDKQVECVICGALTPKGEMCPKCYEEAGIVSIVALNDDDLWEFMTGEEVDVE